MAVEQRQREEHMSAPARAELGLGVPGDRAVHDDVRHPHRSRQVDLEALLLDAAVEDGELDAGGLRARGRRRRCEGACVVERRGERRGRIERKAEQRVELHSRGSDGGLRRRRLVLGLREGELGLQDLEARRAAGDEPLLRGVAGARGDSPQVVHEAETGFGDDPMEVCAANLRPDVDDGSRQLGLAGLHRGFAHFDPPASLSPDLEREREPVRLLRELVRQLDVELRVGPLPAQRDAGDVDAPAEARRGDASDSTRARARTRLRASTARNRPALERKDWRADRAHIEETAERTASNRNGDRAEHSSSRRSIGLASIPREAEASQRARFELADPGHRPPFRALRERALAVVERPSGAEVISRFHPESQRKLDAVDVPCAGSSPRSPRRPRIRRRPAGRDGSRHCSFPLPVSTPIESVDNCVPTVQIRSPRRVLIARNAMSSFSSPAS